MSENIFQDYTDPLSRVINKQEGYKDELNEYRNYNSLFESGTFTTLKEAQNIPKEIDGPKQVATLDFKRLEELFGHNPNSLPTITIGPHPDFENIDHSEQIHHHCVSVFIDIKGSTNLIKKYNLEEIRFIKDNVLTLCIYLAHFFGGHVHRLQGDGIFLQFVRREGHPNNDIINALNASSLITFFIQSLLAEIFEDQGIDPLKVRTGVDYGPAEDVLWSHYGIPGCSELTTTSLHTDLAAKLQANAAPNSIMLGDNIVSKLDLADNFWDYITKSGSDDIDYYVFRGGDINYNQYEFDWQKYLQTFDFLEKDYAEGKIIFDKPDYRLKCSISKDESYQENYYQNLYSLPKETNIKYTIYAEKYDRSLRKQEFKSIKWEAHNTGTEAEDAEQLEHDFGGNFDNKLFCKTSAKYLGHHQAKCKLSAGPHSPTKTLSFPIFVQ
ncbi:hypothetical protein ACG2F4_13470 [Halalkalibaculum sp. DA3122]|uniref:nucleotide-binding domain-containing protein n=1 Tax=Halalkalibaculum sp. DA3122 TaxID=3373607 RepID=UPI0037553068